MSIIRLRGGTKASILLLLVVSVYACTQDLTRPMRSGIATKNVIDGGTGTAGDTVSDNCTPVPPDPYSPYVDDACHDSTKTTVGDDGEECPSGCSSFPLDTLMRKQWTAAIDQIQMDMAYADNPQMCSDVLTFMKHQLLNGYIRKVDDPTIYGDSHGATPPGTGADWRGSIHFNHDQALQSVSEFADTIMHEGYHSYVNAVDRYSDPEEDRAAAFAYDCTGKYPTG